MAGYIKGATTFASTFDITAAGILDSRLTVPSKSDLTQGGGDGWARNNYYPKMVVTVEDENSLYMLVGSDPKVAENWKKIADMKLFDNSDASSLEKKFEAVEKKLQTINELAKLFHVTDDGMDYVTNPIIDCGTF